MVRAQGGKRSVGKCSVEMMEQQGQALARGTEMELMGEQAEMLLSLVWWDKQVKAGQ